MSKKIVLFDLDGTLVNTIPAIANSFNCILDKYGYETYPSEKYRDFVGGGFVLTFDRICKIQDIQVDKNKFLLEVRKHYNENFLYGIKLYDNMDILLDSLTKKGIEIAIVTNKDEPMAIKHANTVLSKWEFKYVYGASIDNKYPNKPNPYLVDLIAKEYNKNDMLFVGDMIVDIETAKNANIDMIYCNWGYGNEININNNVVNDPLEILKYII